MDFNQSIQDFLNANVWWILLLAVWSLAWKGVALWRAAHKNDKVWFVILLILNTVGILEILYIFYFSRQPKPTK